MTNIIMPPFERYHVQVRNMRTTISLDYCLSGLLAAKLGAEPGTAEAHRQVRTWLQGQVDESADVSGLNRRIMRRAVIAIADKMLSSRHAPWLAKIGEWGSTFLLPSQIAQKTGVNVSNPLRLAQETPKIGLKKYGGCEFRGPRGSKAHGVEAGTRPIPPSKEITSKKIKKGRFVLYQAISQLPPDIKGFGETVEELQARMKSEIEDTTWFENWRPPDIPLGIIDKNEREKHGHYYIRRCSKTCWDRLKEKGKKEIKPVADPNGVWMTRKELAIWRRTHLWESVFKPELERIKRKTT